MFRLITLASRNLWRNLRRTVITLAAIASGLMVMVFALNLANGQYQEMIRNGVSSLAGHVVVQADGYQEEKEDTLVVEQSGPIAEAMRTRFPDAVVARRLQLGGLLMSPQNSVAAALQAIEPEQEADMHLVADKIIEGEWLDDGKRGILIGHKMAETLQVGLGDKLVYMGQHGGEDMSSRLFRVRGIFRTGSAEIDGFVAVAHLKNAQELMPFDDPAHQVTLHMHDARQAEQARDITRDLVGRPELDVLSYKEAMPELVAFISIDKKSNDILMAVLASIVAMGVLNTVLMSVMERIREFGVLMAIGMKPRRLAVMVLLEGALLGVVGGILGVGLGLLISWPAVIYGIDFTGYGMGEATDIGGVTVSMMLHPQWDPWRIAQYSVACVFFTVIASIYPAWYVTTLTPVQAIRHH